MIDIRINEIAGAAREEEVGGGENGEKANKMASFQFSVSSFQPGNEEKGKHLSPALVPATASRGEGGDCAAACLTHVEDALAAGLADVAGAGTAALRTERTKGTNGTQGTGVDWKFQRNSAWEAGKSLSGWSRRIRAKSWPVLRLVTRSYAWLRL
jgi:hypothetical protein